ncbi:MAG: hypothetical protein ACI910_002998 [Oleispira sp.]|jgi:hypothetical protein
MKRRDFLSFSLLSVLALNVTNTSASLEVGAEILPVDLSSPPLDLNKLLSFLHTLPVDKLVTAGEWDLAQIFNHAAQSIEYSMDGYPQHKPELFKQTIGPLAFQTFSVWGKMTHALSENILGAPQVLAAQPPQQALLRLEQSIIRFDQHLGVLQPHFAYGKLSKQEYALAHVLHLNNHFEEIRLV